MAGDASGEWKLEKKFLQPGFILTDVRINLAVCSFKIGVAHNRRATMAGPGDVNHVEVVFFDDAVQVRVNKILSGRRAPVSQQHVLHVSQRQWPLQKWIGVEVNLADG